MTGDTPAIDAYASASGTSTAQTGSPAIRSPVSHERRYPRSDPNSQPIRSGSVTTADDRSRPARRETLGPSPAAAGRGGAGVDKDDVDRRLAAYVEAWKTYDRAQIA